MFPATQKLKKCGLYVTSKSNKKFLKQYLCQSSNFINWFEFNKTNFEHFRNCFGH